MRIVLSQVEQKMRKIECEPLDETFLSFLRGLKTNSANSYGSALRRWINFTHMNGKATLDFKRADKDAETEKLVLQFKKYVVGLGKSENSANVGVAAIRGFFAANRTPLIFTHTESKRLQESNRSTQDFLFTKEDLAKMNEQGETLQEKFILLVGKSVGLRAGDFANLTFGMFRGSHLDTEAPVSLGEIATGKEHVKAYPFLDSDAVQVVKLWLERNPDKNDKDCIVDLDEQSLTITLQRMFQRAGLEAGDKRVRFHCLRKFLIDRLSAVASESQWKQIVGKSIAEGAYVSTDQLRDVYLRAMPSIVINGNGKNHAKLEELGEQNRKLQGQVDDQAMRIEALLKRLEELDPNIRAKYHKTLELLRSKKGAWKPET